MSRVSGPQTTATSVSPPAGVSGDFAESLASLDLTPPLALGISGGGDSAALMHLTAAWARSAGIDPKEIFVLTVDHGLRPEAAMEASRVGSWAAQLGFPHHILSWNAGKPQSRLQEKARIARRELLCGWCRDHGIRDLLLAHTGDDQIETASMRLLRESGTAGLGGMEDAVAGLYGVRICRPLLGQTRVVLRDWLRRNGHEWIDDPGNEDISFERVRMRKALAGQAGATADVARLADTAAKARAALDRAADLLLADAARLNAAGWAELDLEIFTSAPRSVGERALSRALVALGGAAYPPNRQSLARIYKGLMARNPSGGTLSGARIVQKSRDLALLGREARNISQQALTARQWETWDHRFEVRSRREATVQPLSMVGLDAFSGADRDRVKTAVPAAFRGSLMVLDFGGGEKVVPHAGVGPMADLEVEFRGLRPFGALRLASPRKRV